MPFIKVSPFKCFPGPMRMACKLTSLNCALSSRQMKTEVRGRDVRHLVKHTLGWFFAVRLVQLRVREDDCIHELANRFLQLPMALSREFRMRHVER